MLLEAGADPNIETPGAAAQHSALLSPRSASHSPQNQQTMPAYTPPTAGMLIKINIVCILTVRKNLRMPSFFL